jgi:hypothetical protein
MISIKFTLVGCAIGAALFVAPGPGLDPAFGKQMKKADPTPRLARPVADRRAIRGYRSLRKCQVPAETRAEQTQKSIARRLCNSSIVDERAEGTSGFR